MIYIFTNGTFGIKNKNIQIEINKNKTFIIIKINESNLTINREYIINNITPNFSVEMLYYVLYGFIKYNNYILREDNNHYIFEGYYNEPYEQGDEIHVKIRV
jgi:hypothetical protein